MYTCNDMRRVTQRRDTRRLLRFDRATHHEEAEAEHVERHRAAAEAQRPREAAARGGRAEDRTDGDGAEAAGDGEREAEPVAPHEVEAAKGGGADEAQGAPLEPGARLPLGESGQRLKLPVLRLLPSHHRRQIVAVEATRAVGIHVVEEPAMQG